MIIVSGLLNVETNLKVKAFPIPYCPIDYPFFKINSNVSGTGMNISKALTELGEEVNLLSFVGKDAEGSRILQEVRKEGIESKYILEELKQTPASIVLYDSQGKRQIYCDLKDVQDKVYPKEQVEKLVAACEALIVCNINFNKEILKMAKKMKKLIVTDVHVIHDAYDGFNKPFMMHSNILFLSDEHLPCQPEEFIIKLEKLYHNEIIIIGQGEKGAMMYVKAEHLIYHIKSVVIREVVNTVGAGDALLSAFVFFYLKGRKPIDALKRAEIFAAYKIGASGGATGYIKEVEIEEWIDRLDFKEERLQELT